MQNSASNRRFSAQQFVQTDVSCHGAQDIPAFFGLVDKFRQPLSFSCLEYHRNQLFQLDPETKAFPPWGEGGCERSEQTDEG